MTTKTSIMMCRPDFYSIDYVINPWMEGNVHKATVAKAKSQWEALHKILSERVEVKLIEPHKGVPDLVFTANSGLVLEKKAVLSRFLHAERQPEEPYFKKWFESAGFEVFELPKDIPFEGAGDALFDRDEHRLWAGYGFRSELQAHSYLADWLDVEVLSLRLIDERFYHLDTCFCPLEEGFLLYYPAAFDGHSRTIIESKIPKEKRIAVSEADAVSFACNAVNLGTELVLNRASAPLKRRLKELGFSVVQTPLGEFMRAGGAAKCLTIRLNELRPANAHGVGPAESGVVHLEGHILDNGLLGLVLDTIVENGGSFRILELDPGQERQSRSAAQIKVFAPDAAALEQLLAQLLGLGGVVRIDEQSDVKTMDVVASGVAPEDFYISTIYPTEVRVDGDWLPVTRQRMDASIVVSPGAKTAECRLMRDLKSGEQVVIGVEGIRTFRKDVNLSKSTGQEFSFMASEVSSERRVELIVEQIAWELRRIKQRGGKVVVTAGPVVVHTGGGGHLAKLIKDGYVHALLGGNAIAVHDIEQAFMGTSLGVDFSRGVPLKGGHQHHLRAINTIRGCGGIAEAVGQGVFEKGVLYECVTRGVPFSLAGSIRDDGPLPDTEMDIVKAQEDYGRLLEGADLVLMLSTMLHAIGVGNMTPAGVKLICVDINPAVVTKLSDRGSLQSVGVVTDVGLFLSLLIKQLDMLSEAGTE